MLDMKFVRDHLDEVQAMLERRHNPMKLDDFKELEKRRREILGGVEGLKGKRNAASKEISVMKKNGENADALVAEMRAVGDKIAALDGELKETEEKLREILLRIPNMPKEDVPLGVDDNDNPELRKWGEPRKFDFEPKAHWDVGEGLGILDAERAAKVSGARFTFYVGLGARLERACINFMMDLHAKQGYTEMPGQHDRHRAAPEIRRGHVQAGRPRFLPGADGGGAGHEFPSRGNHRRRETA